MYKTESGAWFTDTEAGWRTGPCHRGNCGASRSCSQSLAFRSARWRPSRGVPGLSPPPPPPAIDVLLPSPLHPLSLSLDLLFLSHPLSLRLACNSHPLSPLPGRSCPTGIPTFFFLNQLRINIPTHYQRPQ